MSQRNRRTKSPGTQPESPSRASTRAAERGGRAAERQAERERESRRRQRNTTIVIAVVSVLVIAVLIILTRLPADAPIPEGVQTRYADVGSTRSQEGFPRLGDPNAPVNVALFSSFDCVPCRALHTSAMDGLIERAERGDILLTFVPLYNQGEITNGQGAARAALCAAEQGRFWAFHDMLFAWQAQFPANQAFSNQRINTGVANLGLDGGAYDGCVRGGGPDGTLNEALSDAQALLGFAGAPTVTINNVALISTETNLPERNVEIIFAEIDSTVEDLRPTEIETTPELTPEATGEATAEATAEVDAAPMIEATPEATAELTPESTPEVEATPRSVF